MKHENNNGSIAEHLWKGDISGIDHTIVKVNNVAASLPWYQRVFGLVEVARGQGRVYLASPVTSKIVLGLTEGGTGIDYIAYAVYNTGSLDRIAERLNTASIPFTRGSSESRPGAIDAIRVKVPTGHTFELLAAEPHENALHAEYRPCAMDVRTSHMQVRSENIEEMSQFMQHVGFYVSAYALHPNGSGNHLLQFMRVNDRHHQLAILGGAAGIHHVAIELNTDDFWKFCDHLAAIRTPAEYGPGRHNEGDMLFIYVRDPDGNRFEITGPMCVVSHDYGPTELNDEPWFHMNHWGPQPPESWYKEWN